MGLVANVATSYVMYNIISKITTPFKEWEAFKTGTIDEYGNVLVPKDKRTIEQRESFTKLDVMCRNLKRILNRIPGGDSKFATYSAALYLIKEQKDDLEGFKKFLIEERSGNPLGPGLDATTEVTKKYAKETPGQNSNITKAFDKKEEK